MRANPETLPSTGGAFGDACSCAEDAAGCTDICGTDLLCVKLPEGHACMGPVCCEGAACGERLGTTAACGTGRVCGCASGEATCDRGLCLVDH